MICKRSLRCLQDFHEQRKRAAMGRLLKARDHEDAARRRLAGIEDEMQLLAQQVGELWRKGGVLGRADLFEVKRKEALLMAQRMALSIAREDAEDEAARAAQAIEIHTREHRLWVAKQRKFDEVARIFRVVEMRERQMKSERSIEEEAICKAMRQAPGRRV